MSVLLFGSFGKHTFLGYPNPAPHLVHAHVGHGSAAAGCGGGDNDDEV